MVESTVDEVSRATDRHPTTYTAECRYTHYGGGRRMHKAGQWQSYLLIGAVI